MRRPLLAMAAALLMGISFLPATFEPLFDPNDSVGLRPDFVRSGTIHQGGNLGSYRFRLTVAQDGRVLHLVTEVVGNEIRGTERNLTLHRSPDHSAVYFAQMQPVTRLIAPSPLPPPFNDPPRWLYLVVECRPGDRMVLLSPIDEDWSGIPGAMDVIADETDLGILQSRDTLYRLADLLVAAEHEANTTAPDPFDEVDCDSLFQP